MANKVVATVATGAVVAAGGAAVAVTAVGDDRPTVEIEALNEAGDVQDEATETSVPELAPDSAPKPKPKPKPATSDVGDKTDKAEADTSQKDNTDKTEKAADESTKDEDGQHDPPPDKPAAPAAVVDLVVQVSGNASETVVYVHNRGDAASGPMKVKYQAHNGAEGAVRVLGSNGPVTECGSWYCWFSGLEPGEKVAKVVFAVDGVACPKGDGGGKVTAHYDGVDADWGNNYGWMDWCKGTKSEEPTKTKEPTSSADLALRTITGDSGEYVLHVDNLGPDPSGKVKVKVHSMSGVKATVSVLGTAGPVVACDGWYCYFDNLPVGEGVASVRFAVEVHECWDADGGAVAEVHAEHDATDGNDRQWLRLCDGVELTDGKDRTKDGTKDG